MQTRTRVRRLGFYVQRRQWPRTLRRESGGDFRADSRTGLCVIRRSDQAIDERHAGRSAHLFRRCGRVGRCGPASSRDDSSRGQRRTLHRGIGQCHIDGRHRQDSAGPPRDLGQTSAPSSLAGLGCRLAAKRDASVRQVLPLRGVIRNATSEKAKRALGWSPRSNEEAIVDTAESLIKFRLAKS